MKHVIFLIHDNTVFSTSKIDSVRINEIKYFTYINLNIIFLKYRD